MPNGSRFMSNGSRITPYGSWIFMPNGSWMIMPNGSRIMPNGFRITPALWFSDHA